MCPLQLLESSEQAEEPTTFEVGTGDIVGNRLFEASRPSLPCCTCRCLCSALLPWPVPRCFYALTSLSLHPAAPRAEHTTPAFPVCLLPLLTACPPAFLSCCMQAFDEAVRGLAVGDYTRVKVGAARWHHGLGALITCTAAAADATASRGHAQAIQCTLLTAASACLPPPPPLLLGAAASAAAAAAAGCRLRVVSGRRS